MQKWRPFSPPIKLFLAQNALRRLGCDAAAVIGVSVSRHVPLEAWALRQLSGICSSQNPSGSGKAAHVLAAASGTQCNVGNTFNQEISKRPPPD